MKNLIAISIFLSASILLAAQGSFKKYEFIDKFYNGMAAVFLEGKYGVINKNCQEVIACIYEGTSEFREEMACVQLNEIGRAHV